MEVHVADLVDQFFMKVEAKVEVDAEGLKAEIPHRASSASEGVIEDEVEVQDPQSHFCFKVVRSLVCGRLKDTKDVEVRPHFTSDLFKIHRHSLR